MPYICRRVTAYRERLALWQRMEAEDLLRVAVCAGNADCARWLDETAPAEGCVLLVAESARGTGGLGLFRQREYRMWSFDFCAFRQHFRFAVEMARCGFAWIFANTEATSIYGIAPVAHRHALALATACGFVEVARLPKACWLARRECHVDGVVVLATRETLEASMSLFGGGGGSTSTPYVAPAPKAEVTKPVTEAATAARDSQRNKAARAAGLRSTILTGDALGTTGSGGNGQKTLLGQ